MECTDPYYFFLLDNINIPSYSDLHEKSFDSAEFQSGHNNFYTGMLSPSSQIPPSIEMSPLSTNSTLSYSSDPIPQAFTTCFPSPTSSIIEAKKPLSPLLEPRTVKSHQVSTFQHHRPPLGNENNITTPPQPYQQSILTAIDTSSKKKKILGKKQKRINELPYAPNLLNLQFTPALNSVAQQQQQQQQQQRKRNGSRNQSTTPSSSSSSSLAGEGKSILSTTTRASSSRKAPSTYRCDFPDCEKTFTRPYNLKSHRRTHTAERPFDCPLCPKSFARQHDRNRHAKLHLGIKPYTCHFCNKSFARQDALNRHQRITNNNNNNNINASPIPSCGRSIGGRRKTKASSYSSSSSSFPFCHL